MMSRLRDLSPMSDHSWMTQPAAARRTQFPLPQSPRNVAKGLRRLPVPRLEAEVRRLLLRLLVPVTVLLQLHRRHRWNIPRVCRALLPVQKVPRLSTDIPFDRFSNSERVECRNKSFTLAKLPRATRAGGLHPNTTNLCVLRSHGSRVYAPGSLGLRSHLSAASTLSESASSLRR